MMEEFRVKGNRKNKFLNEFAKLLVEHLADDDVFLAIYEQLSEGENVKDLGEDY